MLVNAFMCDTVDTERGAAFEGTTTADALALAFIGGALDGTTSPAVDGYNGIEVDDGCWV